MARIRRPAEVADAALGRAVEVDVVAAGPYEQSLFVLSTIAGFGQWRSCV